LSDLHNEKFEVIKVTEGESKQKNGIILIETSLNGLIYRTDVYLNKHLIDAKEVDCKDLASLSDYKQVFESRYLATHSDLEERYLAKKVFKRVLSEEGSYIDGDGHCIVTTYTSDNIIKTEVILDTTELDVVEDAVSNEIANDEKAFKAKYTQAHNALLNKYVKVERFPVNSFLNPLLKKLPFYKKNPMHSFYFFIFLVLFIFWLISLLFCGKALPKIAGSVFGAGAKAVVKDFQKSVCIKSVFSGEDENGNNDCNKSAIYKSQFQIIPERVSFKSPLEIRPIYIKNNLTNDLIVRLQSRDILGLDNPSITGDMIINIVSPTTIYIKPDTIGIFEFKLEDTIFKSNLLPAGKYSGNLIFDVLGLNNNQNDTIAVEFEFEIIGE